MLLKHGFYLKHANLGSQSFPGDWSFADAINRFASFNHLNSVIISLFKLRHLNFKFNSNIIKAQFITDDCEVCCCILEYKSRNDLFKLI